MKKLIWTIPALVIGASAAFAGASSENNLSDKALEGPGNGGANSTDPNVERPANPSADGAQKGPAAKYNYNTEKKDGATTGSDMKSGTTGSDMKSDQKPNTGASQKSPNESNTP
jgi:hypothetical protein